MSFSLRTLFIGVTALAVWLGYQVNWIRQRHAFLAEQFARHLDAGPAPSQHGRREWVSDWWNEQLATSKRAPWPLWLFGEAPVGRLWVVVRASDVTLRTWGEDSFGAVQWPEITASQPDYRRAKRLFPEAQVRPVTPDESIFTLDRPILGRDSGIGGSGMHIQGVTVRDPSRPAVVHLVCDLTVTENSVFTGHFELNAAADGPVVVNYATDDGTASTLLDNYDGPSGGTSLEAGETILPFTIKIGALTAEQRAAGGATFKIKLDTVVGAVAEVNEKTITIVPSQHAANDDNKG